MQKKKAFYVFTSSLQLVLLQVLTSSFSKVFNSQFGSEQIPKSTFVALEKCLDQKVTTDSRAHRQYYSLTVGEYLLVREHPAVTSFSSMIDYNGQS